MGTNRRGFFAIAGASLVGALPIASVLARSGSPEAASSALAGKKWAMIVDVKKCMAKKDCTACTEACHKAHNVPEVDSAVKVKEELKWIWREPYKNAFPSQAHDYTADSLLEGTLPILCNHCEEPGRVRVCPTQATFKREDGVVLMDMHRCIGCRYCMAACPYGARSFNFVDPQPLLKNPDPNFPTRSKGVVEKCNFCAERLSFGKGPLCVEACKNVDCGALTFGDLGDPNSEVSRILKTTNAIRRKPELGTAPQVFYIV